MKCPSCGAEGTGKFCEYCGSEFPRVAPENVVNDNSQTVINNYYYSGPAPTQPQTFENTNSTFSEFKNNVNEIATDGNRMIALILCLVAGWAGAHYFYVKRWGMGVLYLCTGGLIGVGILVDVIRILTNSFPGIEGNGVEVPKAKKKQIFTIGGVVGVLIALGGLGEDSTKTLLAGLAIVAVCGYFWYKDKKNGEKPEE